MNRTLWTALLSLTFAVGPALAEDSSQFIKKGPRPPDRVSERVPVPFPPPGGTDQKAPPPVGQKSMPLSVVRYQPEGAEQEAHTVSVTFNQPMVAVTSLEEIDRAARPLRIEPEIPGKYSWAGSRTLAFSPEGRIPYATRYKVTVPAGAKAASGSELSEPFVFFFDTPLPQVSVQPYNGARELELNPSILLSFNLAVSGEKIARFVTLKDQKGNPVPVQAIPRAAWKDDPRFSHLLSNQNPERLAAFALRRSLEPNTTYRLEIAEGLSGDEGPLPLPKTVTSEFSTYTPLKFEGLRCESDYYDYDDQKKCTPGGDLLVYFNHSLEEKSLKGRFSVSPRPARLKTESSGSWVRFKGDFKAGVTYRVGIQAGVQDQYGQLLQKGLVKGMTFVHRRARMQLQAESVSVLDGSGSLKLPVGLMNLKWFTVMVYRAEPEQMWSMLNMAGRHHYDADFKRDLEKIKSRQVSSWREKPRFVWDRWKMHGVSLKRVVRKHGSGAYLVVLHNPLLEGDDAHYQSTLVLTSDLALTARYDNRRMVVLATSIRTGKPRPGVKLRLFDELKAEVGQAVTGADGTAVIQAPAPARDHSRGRLLLQADRGKQRSFLIVQGSGDDGRYLSMNWGQPYRYEHVRTFLHADRDLYRPGEPVHVFGISRRIVDDPDSRVSGLPEGYRRVNWKVKSSRGRDLAEGTAEVTGYGRFHFSFKLPADVDLGWTRITTGFQQGGSGSLSVNVQEYRAPQFKVSVAVLSRPLFFKDTLRASIHGDYLFGAPMRGAEVSWNLYGDEARFYPPNHPGFHFGSLEDWWGHHHWYRHGRFRMQVKSGSAKLSEQGSLEVEASLPDWTQSDPVSLTLEAQVTDKDRQTVAGRAQVLSHPADRYVGIQLERYLVRQGEKFQVGLVLVDLEGKRVSGVPIEVKLDEYEAPAKEKLPSCRVQSAQTVAQCEFSAPAGGRYTVTASAFDSKERKVQSQTLLMVYGDALARTRTEAKNVSLLPDKQEYQPDDTATIMLQAPFDEGFVLVTQERNGIVGHELLKLSNGTATVRVPVREEHIPNLHVSATAVARRTRRDKQAAWAVGHLQLKIASDQKRLKVVARPLKKTARPGEKVPLEVRVSDRQDQPVQAQLAVLAVDEAVLSMTGFQTPDPLPSFYTQRSPGVALAETLKRLMPELSKLTPEKAARMAKSLAGAPAESEMASDAGPGGSPAAVAVRQLFLTTPTAELATTDEQGKATVEIQLPDNLTTFRLMAVGADSGDRFGSGESTITVNKPLLARPALPRFANYGDVFDAAVVINNETGQGGVAKVSLETGGITRLDSGTRMAVMQKGQALEVPFRVRANRPGRAQFTFTVTMEGEGDAVQTAIPVWLPATSEAFATYGVTDSGVAQPISPPRDAFRSFGGLDLTLAATALTGLQDAVSYLVEYRYECSEQTSSRVLPIFALGDILDDFDIGGVESRELRNTLARKAIRKLTAEQRSNGAWGYWTSSQDGSAHLSAYVHFVLLRGKEAGFEVPDDTLRRSRRFLVNWMQSRGTLPAQEKNPWWRRYVLDSYAMALYALTEGKQRYPRIAEMVYEQRRELDLFAQAMLAVVFHRQDPKGQEAKGLFRELSNRVVETPAGVHFKESQTEALRMLMHSSSRTDAIALLSYLEIQPEYDLVPKLARALMDSRIDGRWETTQANAYALCAMARYYKQFEGGPSEFTANMWLGQGYLGKVQFQKKTMRESELKVPMPVVFQYAPGDLVLSKDGPGKLYYRIGMRYAPRSLELLPREEGFTVKRSYEAIENPEDVRGDNRKGWTVKAGAYVRVHLLVVVPDRRYYAVVDDPLPAGLEIVNLAYKTSARDRLGEGDAGWLGYWISWMFNHRELRDERALHFADRLDPGVYHLSYITRATTKGDFIVPPTRAEEMYRPEVFGRSGTDRLTVE